MTNSLGPATSISVQGARGGHGATTIAGAMAVVLGLPVTGKDLDSLRWLWADLDFPSGPSDRCVVDAGVATVFHYSPADVVVLRGPCSLGLRTLSQMSGHLGNLVVIREPWRSIRRQDVEASLSTTVAAEVAQSPRVARLADASLLAERVAGLDEFAELKAWATHTWVGADSATPQLC